MAHNRYTVTRMRAGITCAAALGLAVVGMAVTPAAAAAPNLTCGQAITQSVTLQQDLTCNGGASTNGLLIRATNNIVVNLNGHTIKGSGIGADDARIGVRIGMSNGVTVKNGTITGFTTGVAIIGGGNNTLSRLSIQDNVGMDVTTAQFGDGVYIESSSTNHITKSKISRNGRYDGIFIGGPGSDGNRIDYNTITNNNLNTVTIPGCGSCGPAPSTFSSEMGIDVGLGIPADTGIDNTVIDHNVVSNSGDINILIANRTGGPIVSNGSVVTNNTINHAGYLANGGVAYAACAWGYPDGVGLWLNGAYNGLVSGNTVRDNARGGIDAFFNSGNTFLNNTALFNNSAYFLTNPEAPGTCADPYTDGDIFNLDGSASQWHGTIYGNQGGQSAGGFLAADNYLINDNSPPPAVQNAAAAPKPPTTSARPARPVVHRKSQIGK